MAQSASAGQGNFITDLQQGQWRASKLIGTRVVSSNNESIGDVNDLVVDRSGNAQAVIIGVGGFLGIGEKNVAVPFRSLEFASSRDARTTGSTTATTGAGTSATSGTTSGSDTDRVILRMTKAELEAAPTFQGDRSSTSGNTGAGRSTTQGGATGSSGAGSTAPTK
jgi:sporulation protein YlmC with PRC-barrel domain